MRGLFKKYSKSTLQDLDRDHDVLCSQSEDEKVSTRISVTRSLNANDLQNSFDDFMCSSDQVVALPSTLSARGDASIYEVNALPG